MKVDVMGVEFDSVTLPEAVDWALAQTETRNAAYCVTPNAEIVWEAMQSEEFRRLVNGAQLVLPDGAGVVLGAKILGRPPLRKVAGVEFGAALAQALARRQGRLFLLGAKPGVAQQAGENLAAQYPGLRICGTADGYFPQAGPVIDRINRESPDALFVCLGAPKQERFMAQYQKELNVGMMVGLGGSMDFFAGQVRRAPDWMIRCNLEWLYRLVKQPERLGRMMRLPRFVLACKKQHKLEMRRNQNG